MGKKVADFFEKIEFDKSLSSRKYCGSNSTLVKPFNPWKIQNDRLITALQNNAEGFRLYLVGSIVGAKEETEVMVVGLVSDGTGILNES